MCTSRLTKRYASHEMCTSRFTECYACHELCTSRFAKCYACRKICSSKFTERCACHEIYTSRFTRRCACHEICTQSAAPAAISVLVLRGWQSAVPATNLQAGRLSKSYDSLHLHFEVKPLRLSRKVEFGPPKPEAPLRLPRKVTTVCENAHDATTRAQSRQAPAAATQISRACAVEMHIDDFERHES